MIRSLVVVAALLLATLPFAGRADTVPAAKSAAAAANPTVRSAPAADLTVDEIVKRASAQLEHKPKKLVCTVNLKGAQLDSDGKPSETQESELTETWLEGVAEEGLPYKASLDGKPLTAEELTKANESEAKKRAEMKEHEKNGESGDVDSPLSTAQVPRHKFALLRREELNGRPVYVLSVEPLLKKGGEARVVTREGTLVIDAENFVPIRGETHASPLPSHAEKMDFEEEFALTPQGETVPKALNLTVKGGILFFTRTYKVETRWHDCK